MNSQSEPRNFDPNGAAPANSGVFGLPHSPEEAAVVLLGVPFDATTSYRAGASRGPAAIFDASKQVDLFDLDVGRPYSLGIAMLPESPEIAAWNEEARAEAEKIIAVGGELGGDIELEKALARVNTLSSKVNTFVHRETARWLEAGKIVGVIGGDHATPYGNIQSHTERYGELGILHIDAHADLRVAYEGFTDSHASILHNVTSRLPKVTQVVQVGLRDVGEQEVKAIDDSSGRIRGFFDTDIRRALGEGSTYREVWDKILTSLPAQVYVTFDIDGLDPSLCPNTGTPVPGGLLFHEAVGLLRALAQSGRRIVGFDLNEVAPSRDTESDWDGNVAARLLYKMIGFTLLSQGKLKHLRQSSI